MKKEEAIKRLTDMHKFGRLLGLELEDIQALSMATELLEKMVCKDMGDVSDGYHTFNQLYHQRAVLFATIVNQNKDKAWKSLRHEDKKYCFNSDGKWFIVGIDTPKGSYTYHYETDKYWDMFKCKTLECGKHWDGHTEDDVTRLLTLEEEPIFDKIRAEINRQEKWLLQAGYTAYNVDIAFDTIKAVLAESEVKE